MAVSNTGQPGASLLVDWLLVEGFRRIEQLEWNPSSYNVIVGVNGSGKTALLQAIAITLSRVTSRVVSGRTSGIQITQADVRNGSGIAYLAILVSSASVYYRYIVGRGQRGRRVPEWSKESDLSDSHSQAKEGAQSFAKLSDRFRDELSIDEDASLPVIAFYPVNRAVLDIPIRIKGKHTFDQVAAYDGAFENQRNFRKFFEWFREREDLENEERLDRPKHRDPQLQAVRRATETLMDGYRDLRVRRNPLRMTLKKGDEELLINQLSDGEKALLSLVGDLARRMAIANPGLKDPLEGEGVVMIDEVDLHLHPSWQRRVVQKLPETFPNVQFFLTTHSPVVASAVRPEHLWVLRDGEIKHAEAYGQDVGLVLSEVFDTPPRLDAVRHDLDGLFEAIHRQDLPDAQRRLELLESTIGPSDPELVQARVMMQGYAAA